MSRRGDLIGPAVGDAAADDAIRRVAAWGLPSAQRRAEPVELSSDLLLLVNRHRLHGLLWAAFEADAVVGAPELVDQAIESVSAWFRRCLVAEETAVSTVEALGAAGVATRVLKGVAIAHLDHRDPSERVFGDADVLVHRADHERAIEVLGRVGFTRVTPPVWGWWERRFAKAVVFMAPPGGELDLHLAVASGYFGERVDHARVWATADAFDLGGRVVWALDREGRFLHACLHLALGGRSGLRAARDVAQLALVTGADWRAVVASAACEGADVVVAEAVRTAWVELALDPDHALVQWATGLEPDPAQAGALAGSRAAIASGSWWDEGRCALPAFGLVDRIRYLAGLAVPSRASLRARGRTLRTHLAGHRSRPVAGPGDRSSVESVSSP